MADDESIAAKPSGWVDCLEIGEVELADSPECLGGRRVLQGLGQCVEPGLVFDLQREQFCPGVFLEPPALVCRSGLPVWFAGLVRAAGSGAYACRPPMFFLFLNWPFSNTVRAGQR